MKPVELVLELEAIAARILEESLSNHGELIEDLYEIKGRASAALFDLETALAINAMRRQALGLRSSGPRVVVKCLERAKGLLKAHGISVGVKVSKDE